MNVQKLVFIATDKLYGSAQKAVYRSGRELMPEAKTKVIEKHPFFNPTTPIKIEATKEGQNINFIF